MKTPLAILLLLVGFVTPITAWADTPLPTTWKVGLVVCLSGPCASDGTAARNSAELAAADLNAKGGVLGRTVKLIAEDTSEAISGAKVITAYRKLRLDPEIRFYIGPSWAPGGLSLAPIVSKEDVVVTSPSVGLKDFHVAGVNLFNTRGADEQGSRMVARVALSKGVKTGAVFASEQPWEKVQGDAFADEFEKGGGKIVSRVYPDPTIAELNGDALKLVSAKPDLIFFGAFVQLSRAARAVSSLKYTGLRYAAFVDDQRQAEAPGALDGIIFSSFGMPAESFAVRYSERFGVPAELTGAAAYDALMLYARAIEQAKSFDPKTVVSVLAKLEHDGVSGRFHFDSDGGAVRELKTYVVRDGKYVPHSE